MSRPKLLDLFSGAGGAGMGYYRAGFDVTGVDIKPQPRYPFAFHQADALEFLREHGHEYAAIHASPPCQSYLNLTRLNESLGKAGDHPDLIEETRAALIATGRPYVIENVPGAPLMTPIRLCGTSFGLPLRRHRLFESSTGMLGMPCAHRLFRAPRYWSSWRLDGVARLSPVVQVYGQGGGHAEWPAAMGIDWMTDQELALAIPPVYTRFIGAQLLSALLYDGGRSFDSLPEHIRGIAACPDRETDSHRSTGVLVGSTSSGCSVLSAFEGNAGCSPVTSRGRDALD